MTLTVVVAFLAFGLGYLMAVVLTASRRAGEAEYLESAQPDDRAESSDVWWAADDTRAS